MSLKLYLLLSLSGLLTMAQMNTYTRSSTFSFVSDIGNCVVGQNNCWDVSHMAGINATHVFWTGGALQALTYTGCAYTYNGIELNTWTQQSAWGCGIVALQYDNAGDLYALMAGSPCVGGNLMLYKRTGSTWTATGSCATGISASLSGYELTAIDAAQDLWVSYSPNSWTEIGGAGSAISVVSLSPSSKAFAWVKPDHTVWKYVNGTVSQLGTLNVASQITGNTGGGLNLYVLGTDKTVYRWNGTSWDHINSGYGYTSLTFGGATRIYAVGTAVGGNTIYSFSEQGILHVRTVTGNATSCPGGCNGITHTIKVQSGWNGVLSPVTQQTVSPLTYVNMSASATLTDPFACFYGDTDNCDPYMDDNGDCSETGTLFNDGGDVTAGPTHTAYTRVITSNGLPTGTIPATQYDVANYCTVPTTPPDLNAGVNAPTTWLDEPGLQTIDWQADCFPPDASYPHQPYTCSVPFDITTSVVNTGQGVCTHNP